MNDCQFDRLLRGKGESEKGKRVEGENPPSPPASLKLRRSKKAMED